MSTRYFGDTEIISILRELSSMYQLAYPNEYQVMEFENFLSSKGPDHLVHANYVEVDEPCSDFFEVHYRDGPSVDGIMLRIPKRYVYNSYDRYDLRQRAIENFYTDPEVNIFAFLSMLHSSRELDKKIQEMLAKQESPSEYF